MRSVIVHYHIYKNAGTSFDHVLSHNFGDKQELFDGPYPFFTIDQDQLDRIIMRRRDAIAFSSHQILLPPPSSIDYRPISAIFLRNPFLRIASIYRFKRGPETEDGAPIGLLEPHQRASALAEVGEPVEMADQFDMTPTAIYAREHDFAGWLEYCLADPVQLTIISNAQTRFFATQYQQRPQSRRTPRGMIYDLATALRTLCGVNLLGRTENFEQDVARFSRILAEDGITLELPADTRKNVTDAHSLSTVERVEKLLAPLPTALRQRLEQANQQDIALYDRACQLIEQDHRP